MENEKKKFNFKKFIIIFAVVVVLIVGGLFAFYKTCIDLSQKNLDKFDYMTDWEYDVEEISKTVGDDFTYISEDNVIRLDFPKTLLYEKILNFNALNDSLNEKYDLNLNMVGFNFDENDSHLIHFYADAYYKETIRAYVSGTVKLEINSNDIALYFDTVQIGNLPMSITDKFLPIEAGKEIYKVNSQDIIAKVIPDLDEDGAKVIDENLIDLTYFTNLHSDQLNVGVDFKIVEYVKMLVTETFGSQYGDLVDAIMPSLIDEIVKALTENNA